MRHTKSLGSPLRHHWCLYYFEFEKNLQKYMNGGFMVFLIKTSAIIPSRTPNCEEMEYTPLMSKPHQIDEIVGKSLWLAPVNWLFRCITPLNGLSMASLSLVPMQSSSSSRIKHNIISRAWTFVMFQNGLPASLIWSFLHRNERSASAR